MFKYEGALRLQRVKQQLRSSESTCFELYLCFSSTVTRNCRHYRGKVNLKAYPLRTFSFVYVLLCLMNGKWTSMETTVAYFNVRGVTEQKQIKLSVRPLRCDICLSQTQNRNRNHCTTAFGISLCLSVLFDVAYFLSVSRQMPG
jgi:hypothetical protein